MNRLQNELKRIDHRGYPAYKDLKGSYDFVKYTLNIEHVQGDPFASPSSLSVSINGKTAGFPKNYYDEYHRRIALEDFILRRFSMAVSKISFKAKGSGKSGMVSASQPGQEIMERSACHVDENTGEVLFRFVVGFPARGRSIDAGELEKILFRLLPDAVEKSGIFKLFKEQEKSKLREQIELADDQKELRRVIQEKGFTAFIADGSVLPRESGVSQKPMKNAVLFKSPESMQVSFDLPHKGKITGMGIKKGVTLIVGGGYHGKSTLLQTLEKAVYPHIAGDGREYIVTDATGVKLRAEDGRSVADEDISLFIRNLPNGKDTTRFSTLDASGSTSQAANTVEALEAGSRLFLIDEDTSATNFMIRDELMERVISADEEPIVPFIKRVEQLYEQKGVSTILVAGSCGAFFHVADTVIQMDRYIPKEITKAAKQVAAEYPLKMKDDDTKIELDEGRKVRLPKADDRTKIKVMGTDGFLYNKTNVDLRYLEQITDAEQMLAISKALEYLIRKYGGKETMIRTLIDDVEGLIDTKGVSALTSRGSVPNMSKPRRFEIAGCINRFVK
ncbi:ABC-ATPase domain-containing protein [Eubacterium sp. MSJ-13]|uniref:ABC-ATPase domain-containing protein n=1 Tax=Eubacterium sp. MSJ-13 TaxID=2841513 RepID=UPI001C1104B8|nr:ABC-ATPase domain-containing protein [Eubacterium sp. MSJ-13]MBU5478020.1 ABC-ATPase domain-containing protein [Eubacterium sp. MSJ-13]